MRRTGEVSVRKNMLLLAAALVLGSGMSSAAERDTDWPSFRGRNARGVAEGFATAERWDVSRSQNVLWRTPIPGLGHSSPVVWGDRIFVTSAIGGQADPQLEVGLYGDIEPVNDETRHRWVVTCLDRDTGKVLWERTAHEGVPAIQRHTKSTHANSTPATDGKRVVALFGSEGLYSYDLQGELLWKKDLGRLDSGYFEVPEAQWGFGSSPVIDGDKVLVQCDVQQGSFLAAFDVQDGRELWRASRDEVPTWSTPTVHRDKGRAQVITNGWKHVGGYDLATGKELWRMHGAGDIPVPTPVVAHDLMFITHAHRGTGLFAIRTSASGDVTLGPDAAAGEHVAWSVRAGAYMQTPLVYRDELYVCRDNGVLSVYDARTGRRTAQQRLGSGMTGFTASGVAADGKVYYTSEQGDVFVLEAGPEPALIATNSLAEVTLATPAISRGVLYFRTRGHLVAIGERKRATGS